MEQCGASLRLCDVDADEGSTLQARFTLGGRSIPRFEFLVASHTTLLRDRILFVCYLSNILAYAVRGALGSLHGYLTDCSSSSPR